MAFRSLFPLFYVALCWCKAYTNTNGAAPFPLAVTWAPPAGFFLKMANSALLLLLPPLGGRWTVEVSDWLTQFFCLFGVFSMFVCFLFRIYSLIFESCAIVCTVQCYLWDKAAHSRPTIVLLNWTEIRDEWQLSSYHLEGLLSINQPLTAGQQQGAQTGGQFRQITGPNINKKHMNYIAQRCRVTCL